MPYSLTYFKCNPRYISPVFMLGYVLKIGYYFEKYTKCRGSHSKNFE